MLQGSKSSVGLKPNLGGQIFHSLRLISHIFSIFKKRKIQEMTRALNALVVNMLMGLVNEISEFWSVKLHFILHIVIKITGKKYSRHSHSFSL